jgi:hypothetical protein
MCNILLKVCNNLHDSCELNMRLLASYLHAVPAIASWCHGVMVSCLGYELSLTVQSVIIF